MQLGNLRYKWKRPRSPTMNVHGRRVNTPATLRSRNLMPTSIDTHLLTVILVVALVVWRVYARIRRVIGRQRLSAVRPWITVVVFPLIAVLVLVTSFLHPMTRRRAGGGTVVGIGLGVLGKRLTKFEATPAGLFYTPNAHLGIALSLLMVLRLGYRFVTLQMNGQHFDPQSMQTGRQPADDGDLRHAGGLLRDLRDRPAALARASQRAGAGRTLIRCDDEQHLRT